MNTNKLNSKFKLPLSLVVLVLVCILMLSFAFAEVNSGEYQQKNGAGVGLDYKWAGDLDTNLFDNQIVWFNSVGNNVPVTCDIDKDGRAEVIGFLGNTIRIFGMNEFDVLMEEQTIFLTPLNGTSPQINSIACNRMFGDPENDNILIVHQGVNAQSGGANTLGNQILFIEWQPEHQQFLDLNHTYSEDLVLVGAYHNAPQIQAGEITCDGRIVPELGVEADFLCGYANVVSAITFYRPEGVNEFWCDDLQPGSACVYFNITDNAGHKLNFMQEADHANRGATGSYTLVRDEFGTPFWHIMENVNSVSIWGDLFVNPSFLRNSLTSGNMNYWPWSFKRNIAGDDVESVCYQGEPLYSTSADSLAFHWCANADGTLNNLETISHSSGNRIDNFGAFSYYDSSQDGQKSYAWYLNVGQYDDVFRTLPGPVHADSFLGREGAGCGNSGPTITGVCPQNILLANYRDQENKSVIMVGNSMGIWDHNLDTYDMKGNFTIDGTNIIRPIDLNNDNNIELLVIETITGIAHIYSMQPDLLPFSNTIELINTTKVGDGYFGWSTGVNCADNVNITFHATECIGLNTECTYNSTTPGSQERIGSTCGGTAPFAWGDYSFTSPTFDCNLTDGNYNVTLSMESTGLPGVTQATNSPPIPMIVETGLEGATCNVVGEIIGSPGQAPLDLNDDTPVDPGDGPGPGDGPTPPTADPETEPITYLFQLIFGNVPPAVKFFLTIAITLGMAVLAHNTTGGNQFIVSLAGAMGVGMSVILTLLAIETAIVGVIVFVIVAFVHHKFQHPTLSS